MPLAFWPKAKLETTILIVKTACILHNFLQTRGNDQEDFDLPPTEFEENIGRAFNKGTQDVQQILHSLLEKNLLIILIQIINDIQFYTYYRIYILGYKKKK